MTNAFSILLAILAFGFLVAVHELGHFIAAKAFGVQVNEFSLGMGPRLFGFKKGETAYSLRILPIGGYCAMESEDEESDNPRAFTRAAAWKRFIILIAGATMNLIAGFVILIILLTPMEYTTEPVIDSLADQYTESGLSGILPGDRILKINGERVYLTSDIGLLLERYAGSDYDIVLSRGGNRVKLEQVSLEKRDLTFDGEPFYGFGVRYAAIESSFLANLRDAFGNGVDYVRLIRFSLVDLISGSVGIQDMSGPVGITTVMTETVNEAGFASFLNLVAFISINLAVMNLLPLPALDGGRVFFLLIGVFARLFRKKPIPYKYEGYVHLIGLVLFLLLIIYVTFNDITRLIS